MTLTIDQFEIMSNEEAQQFIDGPKFDNDALLQSFPQRLTSEFYALQNTERSNILRVTDEVYMIRGNGVPKRTCKECVMINGVSCFLSTPIGQFEMPCTGSQVDDLKFGYHLGRLKTIAMPTNGKQGKKEYTPDNAASFDFSEENWKSVRTMIGM